MGKYFMANIKGNFFTTFTKKCPRRHFVDGAIKKFVTRMHFLVVAAAAATLFFIYSENFYLFAIFLPSHRFCCAHTHAARGAAGGGGGAMCNIVLMQVVPIARSGLHRLMQ